MSLNFGEIVEPSTRAFWDDYDEDENNDQLPIEPLKWIWFEEQDVNEEEEIKKTLYDPFHCVIIEGQKVSSFVGTAILKGKVSPLCQLSTGTVTVFHLPAEKLILCVSEELEPNLFGHITDKLSPWLDAAETVSTISLLPSVTYKGLSAHEQEKVCFIKALNRTDTDSSLIDIGPLEAPNVITGVAAGAACYRKFRGKHTTVYGCYLDSVVLDSVSSEPILRLLKALRVPCADHYELRFKSSSNLYM